MLLMFLAIVISIVIFFVLGGIAERITFDSEVFSKIITGLTYPFISYAFYTAGNKNTTFYDQLFIKIGQVSEIFALLIAIFLAIWFLRTEFLHYTDNEEEVVETETGTIVLYKNPGVAWDSYVGLLGFVLCYCLSYRLIDIYFTKHYLIIEFGTFLSKWIIK